MIEEWGTPVSKGKIIDRRNRLIEYQKLGELRFTPLYEAIDENILDINYMIYEIERLNKELEVAKTNEETYRLEMLDITKRLGLDELTLFDDVKDKAERLNNIINELEKWLEERLDKLDINGYDDDVFNGIELALQKLKELKGSDKE